MNYVNLTGMQIIAPDEIPNASDTRLSQVDTEMTTRLRGRPSSDGGFTPTRHWLTISTLKICFVLMLALATIGGLFYAVFFDYFIFDEDGFQFWHIPLVIVCVVLVVGMSMIHSYLRAHGQILVANLVAVGITIVDFIIIGFASYLFLQTSAGSITGFESAFDDKAPFALSLMSVIAIVGSSYLYGLLRAWTVRCEEEHRAEITQVPNAVAYHRMILDETQRRQSAQGVVQDIILHPAPTNGAMVHAVTFTLLFLAGTVQAQDVHLLFYSDCTSSVNKQNIGSTETLQSLSARELESIAQTARKSKGTRVSVVQFGTTSRILFRDRVNRRSTPVLQRVYGQLQVPCAVPNTDIVQALNHIVQLIQSRPQDQYLVLLFSDGFHTKSSQNDFYEALAGFAQAMQRYRVRSVGMIGVDGTEIVEIERRLKANIIGSVPSTVVVPIENLATGTKEILAFAK